MKDLLSGYGAIAIGLVIGLLADIGREVSKKGIPSPRYVIAQFLQLGMVGLIAAGATVYLENESDQMQALVAAIFALSANEVTLWLKENGWRRVLQQLTGVTPPDEDEKDNGVQ